MPETEILKLLVEQNPDTCFPKLQPENVTQIAKSLSGILCATSSNDVFQKAGRRDILLLLQKWCCTDIGSHSRINSDNYDCYLRCLQSVEEQINANETEVKVPENAYCGTLAAIAQHVSILEELNNKKQKLLDVISERDKMKLGSAMFETDVSVHFSSNLKVVQCLITEEGCIRKENETTDNAVGQKSRKNRIKFLYALLNFETVDETNLLNVLKDLDASENLHDYEVEFIEQIWKNSGKYGISERIISILLEKYSFVYEKPIIRMCTDILRDNFEKTNCDILKEIVKYPQICRSVTSLLYELYAFSGYNDKLTSLFDLLNV